jgi:SAM-dependent methyltransferase
MVTRRTATDRSSIVNDDLFVGERGWFVRDPDADHISHGERDYVPWRNRDFLRLRDYALHLLDPQGIVLDVGCADGVQMVLCGLEGAEAVYGQDLDPGHVDVANKKLRRLGLAGEAKVGDATWLLFEDEVFDRVISSDFHEHLDWQQSIAYLSEIRRVLKPGGTLVVKTPNLTYLRASRRFKQLREIARGRDPREIVIPHTPGTRDPQHVGLGSRWDLSRQLTEAGFSNYDFHYRPLRRFGLQRSVEVASTEIPVLRDVMCEDLFCRTWKPIALSHFP